MREQLVAWAGDCVVRGEVELGDGRLSDRVNDLDIVKFFDATLRALDDGHELSMGELEVERHELHVIEVHGHRGDPVRRLRTIEERVTVELGPFIVTGNLHRPPNTQPLAALSRWSRFVPMTDAVVAVKGVMAEGVHEDVVLVNRERIAKTEPIWVIPAFFAAGTREAPEAKATA
ncbi:MAG TPA: hypothetical protein VES19_01905 [Candidatus Limnocylindrales bacterium]|nr:hypothetical protein [Candidatus Limnocylindrales bacterium]